jgi:hypothetical protein
MKKVKTLLILLMATCALFGQDITGTWLGVLTIPQGELKVNFHITSTDTGYSSTLDSPDQNAFGIPTDTTIYKKPELKITIAQLGAEYAGNWIDDTKIEGTFTQMGQALKLDLTKKEE